MPGQPFGNVENKRCKKDLDPAPGIRNTSQTSQKEVRTSIFQGISRLPNRTALKPSRDFGSALRYANLRDCDSHIATRISRSRIPM